MGEKASLSDDLFKRKKTPIGRHGDPIEPKTDNW
jgi:hypothetical protein